MNAPLSENLVDHDHPSTLVGAQKLYTLVILVSIIVISYLPLVIARYVFVDEGFSKNDFILLLASPFLSALLMIIFPIVAAKTSPRLAGFDITWIRKPRSDILWIFLLFLIVLISNLAFYWSMKKLSIPVNYKGSVIFFSSSAMFLSAYTFHIAFISPIAEEIFWRGYVQVRLSKLFGPWIALFTQAIAFAALHFRPVGGFFLLLVYGLIFGLWRHRRKSLLPIIITHIIINSLFFIGLWYDWAELKKINIKTDYLAQFVELSKPANYDPNNNAAIHYRKAFELSVDKPEQLSDSDVKAWPTDLPEEKQILLQNWISSNSAALEQIELGTQRPYYWPEYKGNSMFAVALSSLREVRNLSYAICARSRFNAIEGNLKASLSDMLLCYRFCRHFTGRKSLVEQLVGIAGSQLAIKSVFRILDETTPDPNLLKYYQQEFTELFNEQSFVIDFTAEKLVDYDGIQRTFTDDGKGDGHIPKAFVEQMENPPDALKFLFSDFTEEKKSDWEKLQRKETTELVDKIFEYYDVIKDKSPVSLREEGKSPEEVIKEMTKDNPLVNTLAEPELRSIEYPFRCRVAADALITTFAVLRYKAEKNQFPESLDQLVSAGYLKQLPIDPYSDGPLVYKRLDGDFMLYSFGADFDDDGGVHSKWGKYSQGGDRVFWPVQKEEEKLTE